MKTARFLLSSVLLLCLAGCLVGVRVGPVGVGGGVRGGAAEQLAELSLAGIRVDEHLVALSIDEELTYRGTSELRQTLLSPAGVIAGQQVEMTYQPQSGRLELVEAYVLKPDGRRVEVLEDSVFTRPSVSSQQAPAFVSTITTTVLFPQLTVGCQTYVKWRFEDRAIPLLGFNYVYRPSLRLPVTLATVTLSYPTGTPIRFAARGPMDVVSATTEGRTIVIARLNDYPGYTPELHMVAPVDVVPVFVASSLRSWEEIGAKFHAGVADRVEVTPAIAELAARVAGELTGLPAARALHQWVATNVHYVVADLDADDAWRPHKASEVLANGYGDCKDQYVLLASLLKARSIESIPALIDADRSYQPLPMVTALQFDHCLAYLPELDVWSNPAQAYAELGELDVALSDKMVVLATSEGQVSRTPVAQPGQNEYRVAHELKISPEGEVTGRSTMHFRGRPSGKFRAVLARAADDATVANDVLLRTPEGGTGDLETTDPADLDTPLRCVGEWTSEQALNMGRVVRFSTPIGLDFANPQQARAYISPSVRRFPLVAGTLGLTWDYTIELPEGYEITDLPGGRAHENSAGTYRSAYRVERDGRVRVQRHLRIRKDVFDPKDYPDLRQLLYETVNDARSILSMEQRATR